MNIAPLPKESIYSFESLPESLSHLPDAPLAEPDLFAVPVLHCPLGWYDWCRTSSKAEQGANATSLDGLLFFFFK